MMNKEVQDSLKQVGIRMVEEPPLLSPEPMDNPEAAVRVLGEWLSEMDRELFCVVNLNSHLTPINMNVVSMGTLNTVYVNPRETMKSAILSNAAYLMLVHNHPSGSLNPSREDITITDRIQNAASIMGIPVLDHIIVGRNQEFFSLRENNVFSYTNDIEYVSDLSKLQWTQQMSVAERSSYGNRGSEAKESKLDTIMKSLEEGVEKIFTSEQYHIYLDTMAKFHNYSFNNTLLIAMQRPDATLVAGYQTWQKKFQRHVKRGEKGIKIIAPAPVKEKREVEKVDDETQEIIIGVDGQPETEVVERILPRFRVTTVFDVSQTDGEPLPTLETRELDGDVIIYEDFIEGLEDLSPVPFQFIEIESGAKGYYSNSEKYIAIQSNMSQAQTMKTAVHETAHAILHDRDIMEENGMTKDRMTKEVEAESVAYVVCNHFGLDTSDYSFSYIASWSSGKEMSELRSSMDTIRTTSSQFISDITDRLQELQKNKELEKENDDKVINSDDVVVKFSAEFDTEWEVIKYSTIWRELQRGKYIHRNGDWTEEEHYSYNIAQERCNKKKKEHGKGLKLGKDYKFVEYIERKILDEKKSLQVALYDIKRENLTFDTDVCLATLYNYVRSGMFYNITMDDMPMPRKKKRIRKRKKQKRASVGTSIDQRPEEINNREQVGHWEMDSVVGPQGKSKKTFLVLTERKSLKEIIEPLKNHSSNEVVRALDRLERELGEKKFREIFKSITVDNGMEFSDHEGIERSRRNKKNRTKVYYCHAYRSCERARNENQNRFIRRFYPKGANFDHITRREVKEIEVWMNDYARKMFDGRTSDEMYELFREEEKEWNMA